jgi:hypothetical protein
VRAEARAALAAYAGEAGPDAPVRSALDVASG